MLTLNTNIPALIAQGHLAKTQSALSTAIERLSSGLRINSAKDDPAGLAIANRMTANIRGLTQASRNTNDGISMALTAEGALDQINENIQRIRVLSVQAANGSNTNKDRTSIQQEIEQRLEEIERISEQTHFNGINLLGNGARNIAIQVGAHDGQTIEIEFSTINKNSLGLDGFTVAEKDGTVPTADPLKKLDDALQKVDDLRSHLGAIHNRFESVINTNNNMVVNLSAARSRIQDADYAVEISNMLRAQVKQQIGMWALAQANQTPNLILTLLQQSLGR